MKVIMKVSAVFMFLLVLSAHAQIGDNLSVHGFGGWAAGETSNENIFNFATKDGEYNNYYFSLNLTSQPVERLSINSQIYWGQNRHEQSLNLDYIFAQYSYSPELNFRLGKVKSPFGLYAEIYDVGTLRPFYFLPAGMYQSIYPKSYVGLGITGEYTVTDDWTLAYDLIAGEMALNSFYIEIPSKFDYSAGFPVPVEFEKTQMTPVGREVVGTKLSLSPPVAGLNVGFSYINFKFDMRRGDGPREGSEINERHYLVSGFFDYTKDVISLKSEIYQLGTEMETAGGYVQAAYTLLRHWQVAVSHDWYEISTASTVERTLAKSTLKHKSTGFGVNYWFNPNLVIKANYYMIDGNAFSQPTSVALQLMNGENIKEKTDAFIIGTQFSF
jgi:hypothetical protein